MARPENYKQLIIGAERAEASSEIGWRSALCWDAVCAICIRARQKLRCYDFLIDIAALHKIFGIILISMRYNKICAPRVSLVLSVRILEIDAGRRNCSSPVPPHAQQNVCP